MNEPRDDLFPGARLSRHEDRGVGVGNLRRLREHRAPFGGLANHAAVPGLRIECAGERGDTRFELLGACVRLGHLPRGLRQLLVRDRECDVMRDTAGRCDVGAREDQSQAMKAAQESTMLGQTIRFWLTVATAIAAARITAPAYRSALRAEASAKSVKGTMSAANVLDTPTPGQ